MQKIWGSLKNLCHRVLPMIWQYRLALVLIAGFACVLAAYGAYNQKVYGIHVDQERERVAVEKATQPAWERKVETETEMRLGLMGNLRIELENNYTFASDIEDRYTAVPDYLRPLAFFRSQMQSFQPHYIINLGNAIAGEGQDSTRGAEAMRFVRRQFEKINAPTLWAIGNRDLRALTRTQIQELTDTPMAPYTIDYEDYRLIVLDTNNNSDGEAYDNENDVSEHSRGAVTVEQIEWLKQELDTTKHVVVFMHHGAFDSSVEVKGKREKSISDAQTLREIFGLYNVSAVFTAHLRAHAYETHRGVTYYSLESIKDAGGDHPGAFYEAALNGSNVAVNLYYIGEDGERLINQPYKENAILIVEE